MAVVLTVCESDMLYQSQEQNLFLHTQLFFQQQMVHPGGLLTWMGSYLTQFFYYPVLGTGLLCLFWALFMFVLQHTFRIPSAWALLPVACLLMTIVNLGYWIYFLKLHGHLFDATLGSLFAVSMTGAYRCLPRNYVSRLAFLPFAIGIGYVCFGFYALWGGALMAVIPFSRNMETTACKKPLTILTALVVLVLIIFVPLGCYYYCYHETNIALIYWAALPVYAHNGGAMMTYYLPFIALVLLPLFFIFVKPRRWVTCGLLLTALMGVIISWHKDANFHHELKMARSMEQSDWKAVLLEAEKVKGEPTRAICTMRNLALFRTGRMGEEMFAALQGDKRPDAPFNIPLIHTVGRAIYLQYGLANYCYRWCMEDGVEYGWTVEKLKLMTRCALVNNELAVAQKYLNLLRKTDFHKDWARRYARYLREPQLLADDAEMQFIIRLKRIDNFLTNDQGQVESFLLEHFATAQSSDPLVEELTMMAALQWKSAPLFWAQFVRYTSLHQGQRLPRHYQEAACMFGHLEQIDMSRMPFDLQVSNDYREMALTMNQCHQQGMSIEQMAPHIPAHLRSTYYYYYYFNRTNYSN
jgi:hypothetical protein